MRMRRIVFGLIVCVVAVILAVAQLPDARQTSAAMNQAESYSPTIQSVAPSPPYCVLRNSNALYERLLVLTGQGFPSGENHHLQFRNVNTTHHSIHFGMEVNWESATRITIDMGRIKHLLWDDSKLDLTVRVTGGPDFEPLSGWSPTFTLADDAATCGLALPTPTPLPAPTPVPAPVRGEAGDLWADVIIGKPDFSEFTPYEVVPYKVFNPGGVIVDRSVSPGRAYIWDSGNSRILGIDLSECYASDSPCPADIVIGQPSGYDHSACNNDSGFQRYPERAPASATTLCGIPEDTLSILEHKTFVSMAVDEQGNLYVPDSYNHRVLKYISPFSTDTVADEVWGQTDFSGNLCNRVRSDSPSPDASSLCFHSLYHHGAGVELDPGGNLWVADGGNNRIVRFSKDLVSGDIAKTADLVIGQVDFTSASSGSTLDKLDSPAALRFGPNGWMYVVDSGNDRVLVFKPPFTSGMSATSTFGSHFRMPLGIEIDPDGEGIWINDFGNMMIELWDWDGTTVKKVLGKDTYKPDGTCGPYLCYGVPACGGGIGIDSQGNILAAVYGYTQDILRFPAPIPAPEQGKVHHPDKRLFHPPGGYNLVGDKGLRSGLGVAVWADQLVVADAGRLMFWNDVNSLTSGKPADGIIGDSEFRTYIPQCCGRLKTDEAGRLWVQHARGIDLYELPLYSGATPLETVDIPSPALSAQLASGSYRVSPLSSVITTSIAVPVLGGGITTLGSRIDGLAPVGRGQFVWISDTDKHRVLRIRDPLNHPMVDVVLGQVDPTGDQCNRGLVPAPNTGTDQVAAADMICFPGALSLDQFGNLYVSDHTLEVEGNWRLLVFASDLFASDSTATLFAPAATKVFPFQSAQPAPTWEPAFDSMNRMVVGYNAYWGGRFVGVYDDPLGPRTDPDTYLFDYGSMPYSATFDRYDNLYVGDLNRSRVLIYLNPFDNPRPVVVTIEDGSGPPGTSENTILVSADNQSLNDTPIAAGEFRLVYDSSIGLTLTDVRTTDRTQGFAVSWSLDEADASSAQAHVLLYSTAGATIASGTGPILQLVFDVDAAAEAGTSSSLHFSNFLLSDQLGNTIPVDSSDAGQFLIGCKKDGDINDDGNINVFDLQILINMILHSPQPDTALYPADWWCRGDLQPQPDGDGQWNVFDLQRLICLILGTCEEDSSQIADTTNRAMQPGGNNVISLGHVYAPAGTSGAFDIECENVDSISAAELSFTYDSTIGLVIGDVSTTSRTDGWTVAFSKDAADPMAVEVHILMYNMGGWEIDPGTGAVLSVDYTLADDARGQSELTVTQLNLSDRIAEPLDASARDGTFRVTQSLYLPLVLRTP